MPPIPTGLASPAGYAIAITVTVSGTLLAVAWMGWDVAKGRLPLSFPPLFLVSALLCPFADPGGSVTANFQYFLSADSTVLATTFGRPIGFLQISTWTCWMGLYGYAAIYTLRRKWSPLRLWALYAACVILNTAAQWLWLNYASLFTYYGSQPFRILGVPFVWPFLTVGAVMVAGVAAWFVHSQTTGYRKLFVLPTASVAFMACYAATAWPTTFALGTELPILWSSLLGMMSLLLVFGVLDLLFRRYPTPR
ncbi:hypothetical protein [Amycolatopsis sp. NPDC051071]|uniref:hypothetical protein n=1 Tax=Amycolatopsis sp. NPDC051071 TaxID=3154637 RepID=UPI00343C5EC7